MGIILRAITFLSIIPCVMCYKYRRLADSFFVIENICRFLACLHLNSAGYATDNVDVIFIFVFNYLLLATLNRIHIVISTPNFIWHLFIGIGVAYNHPFTQSIVLLKIFSTVVCFWACTMMNMVYMQLAIISQRMKMA